MDAFLNMRGSMGMASFGILMLWTLFWKGLALWQAARRGQSIWYVILLVVSTFGILEIVYLFFILKIKPNELLNSSKHDGKGDEQK